jgi:hypothetical protein
MAHVGRECEESTVKPLYVQSERNRIYTCGCIDRRIQTAQCRTRGEP